MIWSGNKTNPSTIFIEADDILKRNKKNEGKEQLVDYIILRGFEGDLYEAIIEF